MASEHLFRVKLPTGEKVWALGDTIEEVFTKFIHDISGQTRCDICHSTWYVLNDFYPFVFPTVILFSVGRPSLL